MTFAWPWAFLLALPLAFAAWRMLRRGCRGGVRFSAVSRLPRVTAGWRARAAAIAPWVFLIGLAALVVAAARPRRQLDRSSRSVDAIAIAMTVDVSGSMDALDLSPQFSRDPEVRAAAPKDRFRTRLDAVKETFAKFIERRSDDLIGLVTFGGYASSRVPLTADHEALMATLRGVEVPSVSFDSNGQPVDGEETMTAIGDGLMTALARLSANTNVSSKVVILLSDGVSNTGAVEPDDAARACAAKGVKVYVIGVGTKAGRTPFFAKDLFGRRTIRYADMSFDEAQLKSIAGVTGGRYFAVNDNEGLEEALAEIDRLEKTSLESDVYRRWREFFPPFLLWGALAVALSVSLQMAATRRPA